MGQVGPLLESVKTTDKDYTYKMKLLYLIFVDKIESGRAQFLEDKAREKFEQYEMEGEVCIISDNKFFEKMEYLLYTLQEK